MVQLSKNLWIRLVNGPSWCFILKILWILMPEFLPVGSAVCKLTVVELVQRQNWLEVNPSITNSPVYWNILEPNLGPTKTPNHQIWVLQQTKTPKQQIWVLQRIKTPNQQIYKRTEEKCCTDPESVPDSCRWTKVFVQRGEDQSSSVQWYDSEQETSTWIMTETQFETFMFC